MKNIQYLIILFCFLIIQCSTEDNAVNIDMNISGVTDSVYSMSNQVFYVLNSDYDNSYKTGSILAVSSSGEKLFSQEVPRMGRALKIGENNSLIALFEGSDDKDGATVIIYKIKPDSSLELVKNWEGKIDCSPNALATADSYGYYAVGCGDGSLFVGDINASFFNKVRNYRTAHGGIFIDKNSGLIFSFPSFVDSKYAKDLTTKDECAYSEELNSCEPVSGGNEVPDIYENNKISINKYKDSMQRYQVAIYSINQELSKPEGQRFMFEELSPDTTKVELKFVYDTVENGEKKYKTGFADSVVAEDGSIYISRRVSDVGEIIKLRVKKGSVDGSDKITDILDFEEVVQSSLSIDEASGFDASSFFPGKLNLVKLEDKNYLVANHFKSFVYFPSKDVRLFGYSMFDLDQKKSVRGIMSKDTHESYYALSVGQDGKGLSGAFYGDKLIPLSFREDGIVLGWDNLDHIE